MKDIQLTITLFEDGRVKVDGPTGNMILYYGLLEAAKDVLRDETSLKRELRIAIPPTLKL